MNILEVKELRKYYPVEAGVFRAGRTLRKAVDGVSFSLGQGQTLGIAGESGCGKTTLAKLILKLIEPTGGEVIFSSPIENIRKDVGIVFQDPFLSLDPRMRVRDIVAEPLLAHRLKAEDQKIKDLLRMAGLDDGLLGRYPAQLSGGQRQRVAIARGIALSPRLLVLDEPVSSLDLISQRQVLDLLLGLKSKLKMTYIFISHNLAVIKKISDRVMVMLSGRTEEDAGVEEIFSFPKSPYTKKLLEAAR